MKFERFLLEVSPMTLGLILDLECHENGGWILDVTACSRSPNSNGPISEASTPALPPARQYCHTSFSISPAESPPTRQLFPIHSKSYKLHSSNSHKLLGMASRSFSKALRSPLARQITAPAVQRRTMVSALAGARATAPSMVKTATTTSMQQVRGVKTVDFAGHKETVYGMSTLLNGIS